MPEKANIIILGAGGSAGDAILRDLAVKKDHVFAFHTNLTRTYTEILLKFGGTRGDVDVVNWIGHGSAWRILYESKVKNEDGTIESKDETCGYNIAAKLFDLIKPQKVVIWACNTGLLTAKNGLNNSLWNAYSGSAEYTKSKEYQRFAQTKEYRAQYKVLKYKQYAAMKMAIDKKDVNKDTLNQSFVYKVAKSMKISGVYVYGPTLALPPGGIKAFNTENGPGNLIYWKSRGNNKPETTCPESKWRYVAVTHNGSYNAVCKYEEVEDQFIFTYFTRYCES